METLKKKLYVYREYKQEVPFSRVVNEKFTRY